MTDDGIERILEEGVKACRDDGHERLFYFRVAHIEVGVCPRCLTRFVADPLQGDGGEWDRSVNEARVEAEALEAAIDRHPASDGVCIEGHRRCHPRVRNGPSGRRLRHGFDCPVAPGEAIHVGEYVQHRRWER